MKLAKEVLVGAGGRGAWRDSQVETERETPFFIGCVERVECSVPNYFTDDVAHFLMSFAREIGH